MNHAGDIAELKLAEELVEDFEVFVDVLRVVWSWGKALGMATSYFQPLFCFQSCFEFFHFPIKRRCLYYGSADHNVIGIDPKSFEYTEVRKAVADNNFTNPFSLSHSFQYHLTHRNAPKYTETHRKKTPKHANTYNHIYANIQKN